MSNLDLRMIKDTFSRLFVLAKQNKMNLEAFSISLLKSVFVEKMEDDKYDDYFNKSILDIFYDISGYQIDKDTSYGVFDDAFWSGSTYFELHFILKKSFSYLFLKLPLPLMLDLYKVYHEMDISLMVNYFKNLEVKKTILKSLLEMSHSSIRKVSETTKIKESTLNKYVSSDETLYNASFQNINKLQKYFDVPYSLFIN